MLNEQPRVKNPRFPRDSSFGQLHPWTNSPRFSLDQNKILLLLIIITILLFGGFLRFYGIEKSPPSLNWDEASLGYNAYSILKTGKDEYGVSMPLFTRSFDDYKSAIPVYLASLTIAVFGLNEAGVRFPSIVAGLISTLLVFLISNKMFGNKMIAVLAAFFMSISPFGVYFSRGLWEANISLTFFLVGFYFLLYKERQLYILLSIFFFILSMYTYHSYKLFIPLLLISQLLISFRKSIIFNRYNFKIFIFGILFLLPLIIFTLGGQTLARVDSTTILKLFPPPLFDNLNFQDGNLINNLLFHNPIYLFFWEFIGRYFAYFSPLNLFAREAIEPGFRIPNFAVLSNFTFIFWAIGLITLIYQLIGNPKVNNNYKYLLAWVLLSPIPAALTWNWFHAVRALPLFVSFIILSAYGVFIFLNFVTNLVKKITKSSRLILLIKNSLIFGVFLFGFWNGLFLFDSLLIKFPRENFGNYQPGFRESMKIIKEIEGNYDKIIIESPHAQPYIFTLFYSQYDPLKYQKELNFEIANQIPRKNFDFGKIEFRKIYWPEDKDSKKTILMGTVYSLPEQDIKPTLNAKIIEDIKDKSGVVSVRIVTLD